MVKGLHSKPQIVIVFPTFLEKTFCWLFHELPTCLQYCYFSPMIHFPRYEWIIIIHPFQIGSLLACLVIPFTYTHTLAQIQTRMHARTHTHSYTSTLQQAPKLPSSHLCVHAVISTPNFFPVSFIVSRSKIRFGQGCVYWSKVWLNIPVCAIITCFMESFSNSLNGMIIWQV